MDDLIKRIDVLNVIHNFFEHKIDGICGDCEEVPVGELQLILNDNKILSGEIKAIPTVEPVRGEWIDQHVFIGELYKCSLCGAYAGRICNFCPDCGADMRKMV